jgi:hypothetical protein
MPRRILAAAALLVLASASFRLDAQSTSAWDEKLRAIPDARAIGDYLKRLTARPHRSAVQLMI